MAFWKDFDEILTAEMASTGGGLLAGTMLALITNRLELIPALLIFLPGFLEMRGNISGSLSARLSSALFLGAAKPKVRKNRILKGNVIAALLLVVVVSVILGAAAFFMNAVFFGIYDFRIIYIAFIAGILSNVVEVPLAVFTTFWLFRHGHDPNNIMGPYITTTGDISSVISVFIAIVII
ncbi:MAG TPA: magnesium transporter [archaeon]|nr:magnesium transporter [archaeon]